ncbi:hypothetical protein DFS34DRAFT_594453 [Phlyctochytrium arcticum]|nr:hypothetical protein DFS34DRAFT_594453 [Phlyctochytrium arcticum]
MQDLPTEIPGPHNSNMISVRGKKKGRGRRPQQRPKPNSSPRTLGGLGLPLPPEIIAQIVKHYLKEDTNDDGIDGCPRKHRRTIIGQLSVLSLVSQAWRDVVQPRLWSRVNVHYGTQAKQLVVVHTALAANPQLGRFIKNVTSLADEPATSHLLKRVANHCPNLEEMWLGDLTFSNQELCELAQKCDKLARLDLSVCPNITQDGWIRAASFLKTLRFLKLMESLDFGDKAACAIVDSCPLLKGLDLYRTNLTCDGVSYIILNAPKLVRLVVGLKKGRIERTEIEAIWRDHPARLDFHTEFCKYEARFTRKKYAEYPKQT